MTIFVYDLIILGYDLTTLSCEMHDNQTRTKDRTGMPPNIRLHLAGTPYHCGSECFKRLIFKIDLYILVMFKVSHPSKQW